MPSGRTTVTTSGTPVVLSATAYRGIIIISPLTANTNPVAIGFGATAAGSGVVGAAGTRAGVILRPTDPPLVIPAADARGGVVRPNTNNIWIDCQTNGEGVSWTVCE
jgi:hypothetical protein